MRDVTDVGEQPVGDIRHRGGTGIGGHPTLTVRRFRHQMPTAQLVELANIAVPQRISRSRATKLTDDGQRVAGPGAAATHRFATVQVAKRGHRDHPLRGTDQITADDASAEQPGLVPHAVGQLQRLL